MKRIHVLTGGFKGANGSAFLYPFVRHRRALLDVGLDVKILTKAGGSTANCDLLFVDSKYFRVRTAADQDLLLSLLSEFAESTMLWWFDTTDSTGTLQSKHLDVVSRYYKAQLLRDRSLYTSGLYGDRIYSDYYHRAFGIDDKDTPRVGPPLTDAQLAKLHVSWNSGMGDYSLRGALYARAYARTKFRPLIRAPRRWTPPSQSREFPLSGRFGIGHRRATVRYQRQRIRDLIGEQVSTHKISRRKFLEELRHSFAVVSPFGWGEITLRDFEIFINGGLLIKPDMSHLETWPPLYENHETYLGFRWDFSDLNETIDWVQSNLAEAEEIAIEGQRNYKAFLADPWGQEQFVMRLHAMVSTI
jgi:hypothetical protein